MESKIGIVITDGVGFRNFFLSGFLNRLSESFDEITVFSGIPVHSYYSLPENIRLVELSHFKEPFVTWIFRKMKELAHLFLHRKKAYGMNDILRSNYSVSNSPRGITIKLIYQFIRFFHSEKSIRFYERLQFSTFRNKAITKEYSAVIQESNINFLFFTHQRPSYLSPFLFSAKKLEIPTCSFIFSWDNLSSKGRMLGEFTYYFP